MGSFCSVVLGFLRNLLELQLAGFSGVLNMNRGDADFWAFIKLGATNRMYHSLVQQGGYKKINELLLGFRGTYDETMSGVG